jgi:hypothetical protein
LEIVLWILRRFLLVLLFELRECFSFIFCDTHKALIDYLCGDKS